MFRRAGKFYADWWDIDGVRRRKCFKNESDAIMHEHLQAAARHAIRLGREERSVELLKAYSSLEQVLRALTDTVGWSPFTLREVQKSIDKIAGKARPDTTSRLADLSLQIRRQMLLDIILSGIMQSESVGKTPLPAFATSSRIPTTGEKSANQ